MATRYGAQKGTSVDRNDPGRALANAACLAAKSGPSRARGDAGYRGYTASTPAGPSAPVPTPSVPPRPGCSEKEWLGTVTLAAKVFGWWVFHPFDSRRSEEGFPDLFMLRADRAVAAELKVGRGRVTHAQLDVLGRMAVAGIEIHVWRHPGDWDRVIGALKPLGWGWDGETLTRPKEETV